MFAVYGIHCYKCENAESNEDCSMPEHLVDCDNYASGGTKYDICQTIVFYAGNNHGALWPASLTLTLHTCFTRLLLVSVATCFSNASVLFTDSFVYVTLFLALSQHCKLLLLWGKNSTSKFGGKCSNLNELFYFVMCIFYQNITDCT